MKKYILAFIVITALGMIIQLFNNQSNLYSNAGGAESSGNCTSCHIGTLQASDNIVLQVLDETSTPITSYTPDKKYTLTIQANNLTNSKFGFALSATSGTLAATGAGTQKRSAYLTHTLAGTNADARGGKSWNAEWTAPQNGNVTFQLYVNAANNNDQNTGDVIYGKTLVLTPTTTGVKDVLAEHTWAVYPNPARDVLNIYFELKERTAVKITLLNSDGRLVKELINETVKRGTQHIPLPTSGLASGVYLMHVSGGDQTFVKRVIIN